MAFPTYFIYLKYKNGNWVPIPWKFIEAKSFSVTPNQRQDRNSYRDNKGKLHRTVQEAKPSSIKWTVPEGMTYGEKNELMAMFNNNYSNSAERKIQARYYDDETDTLKEDYFYLVQPTFTRNTVDVEGQNMVYGAIDIELIGYNGGA